MVLLVATFLLSSSSFEFLNEVVVETLYQLPVEIYQCPSTHLAMKFKKRVNGCSIWDVSDQDSVVSAHRRKKNRASF